MCFGSYGCVQESTRTWTFQLILRLLLVSRSVKCIIAYIRHREYYLHQLTKRWPKKDNLCKWRGEPQPEYGRCNQPVLLVCTWREGLLISISWLWYEKSKNTVLYVHRLRYGVSTQVLAVYLKSAPDHECLVFCAHVPPPRPRQGAWMLEHQSNPLPRFDFIMLNSAKLDLS